MGEVVEEVEVEAFIAFLKISFDDNYTFDVSNCIFPNRKYF